MSLNIHVADTLGYSTDNFDNIIASAESLQSAENLNTSLRNVLDLFIRTGNVLKVSVTRFNRSVKRGELEKYVNDHTLIVNSIEKLNYFDVKDMGADKPFGMKGKYIDAVKFLVDTFYNLDAPTMLDAAYSSFNRMRTAVLRDEDISTISGDLHATLSVKQQFLDNAAKTMNSIFTKINHNAKFKDMFSSMEEFRATKNLVIDAEKYLAQADGLSKKATELSAMVYDITSLKDAKIDNKLSNEMADSAILTAKILDLYGTSSLNLMSISHNLTLIFNAMYTKVK